MAAAKSSSKKSTARKAATGVAKGAAAGAAKGAAKSTARTAGAAGSKVLKEGGERIGRGTRWTEEQVLLLLDTVAASATAKEAFEKVAAELNKSAGTVAQKYYNMQKAAGVKNPGEPKPVVGAGAVGPRRRGGLPTAAGLRDITIDELTSLAQRVRDEIDRRREELDAAQKLLVG
jgi:hypothetical protein